MRIRPTSITIIIIGIGFAGLAAFRGNQNSELTQMMGLGAVVVAAIILVAVMIISGKQRLAQMRIVADRTGFTLLSAKTPMFGDTPSGLFGISLHSDKWPDSANFPEFFHGFNIGIKRSAGPAVYGNDESGVTWFILQYEYTDSSYRGLAQNFAVVLAKTNLNLPPVSFLSCNSRGAPTLANIPGVQASSFISSGTTHRFEVKDYNPPQAETLLTPSLVEAMKQIPQYDYAVNGQYVMACISDEYQAEILLSMKASIEKILEAINLTPHG